MQRYEFSVKKRLVTGLISEIFYFGDGDKQVDAGDQLQRAHQQLTYIKRVVEEPMRLIVS